MIFRIPLFCLAVLLTACSAPETELDVAETDGHQRMLERLEEINRTGSPLANPFRNVERLEALEALSEPEDPEHLIRLRLERAVEALRAGDTEQAIEVLEWLDETVGAEPERHPSGLLQRIQSFLAVAHLRLGEQENCLELHDIKSCLMPIEDSGVHRKQRGSRAAMAVYRELLEAVPGDMMSLWLYNLAAMTVGEWPEAIPQRWRLPPEIFESDADIGRFDDLAVPLGLDAIGLAGGVVVEDFDGDGWLDVMVSSWGHSDQLRLFRSLGASATTLAFEEVTERAGLSGLVGGLNIIHADYDNDGDADVLVLRGAWLRDQGRQPNSLLANDGAGHFRDVTEAAGLLSFRPTQAASWADFDGDGWLDLYIGNEEHPCELYLNLGDGTFEEVAASAGVLAGGPVKGVAAADFDNDGLPDLYLSRITRPNLLFRNLGPDADGVPHFEELGASAGVTRPDNGFPTWSFDYDNDGWLDLWVGGYGASFLEAEAVNIVATYLGESALEDLPRLYRNNGDWTFTDLTLQAGLDLPLLAMGANYGDLDNDGWLDFFVGTGAPDYRALVPNRMYRNNAGTGFQDITTSGGFGHLQKGHGIAFADLDNDGDQDIVAVMGGAFSGDIYQNAVFANPGHDNRWLSLELEGVDSNRAAIGARIAISIEEGGATRTVHAIIGSGGSFGASPLRAELGLGRAESIVSARIDWPGAERQELEGLELDHAYRVREGLSPIAHERAVCPLPSPNPAAHHHPEN